MTLFHSKYFLFVVFIIVALLAMGLNGDSIHSEHSDQESDVEHTQSQVHLTAQSTSNQESVVDPLDAITSQNEFTKTVKNNDGKLYFVKFFAPWCGHCQRLAPDWKKLAIKYNVQEPEKLVRILSVDCTSLKQVCSAFSVKGYPTLLAFLNGEVIDEFAQQRTFDSLVSFVERLIKPMIFDGHIFDINENIYIYDTVKRGTSWLILVEDDVNFFDDEEISSTADHYTGTKTLVTRLRCHKQEEFCKKFDKVTLRPSAILLQGGSYIVSKDAKSAVSLKQFVSEGLVTLSSEDLRSKFPRPGLEVAQQDGSWLVITLVAIVGIIVILMFFICLMVCLYLEEDDDKNPKKVQ